MSWYFTYYLGYKKKDDVRIYPLGPFDCNGCWHSIFSDSRTFASDIYRIFHPMRKEYISDEFRKALTEQYGSLANEEEEPFEINLLSYCSLEDLPKASFRKTKYCLTSDVMRGITEGLGYDDLKDLDRDSLSLEEYAVKAAAELKTGAIPRVFDYDGEEMPQYSCKDYTLFSWEDCTSAEYDAYRMRQAARIFEFSDVIYKDEGSIVIICQQG